MIDGVVITFEDITTRLESESGLRRLATVVKDSNDAITLQDGQGNIVAWNRGEETMYGYAEDEALKMNIRDIVPQPQRKQALELVKRIFEGEVIESLKTQRVTKDRQTIDVWITLTVIRNEAGDLEYLATTERDITQGTTALPQE